MSIEEQCQTLRPLQTGDQSVIINSVETAKENRLLK